MTTVATMPVVAGGSVCYLGDSTNNGDSSPQTDWWSRAGNFGAQLQAQLQTSGTTRYSARLGNGATSARLGGGAATARQGGGGLSLINGSVNGYKTADVIANFATLYTGQAYVTILVGTNDAGTGVTLGTFSANYAAILTAIHNANPTAKILCCGIPCRGEAWNTGPVWNNGAIDATLDSFNAAIAAAAAAALNPCTYLDFRTPLLAWEVTNNPGKAASGAATSDGIHWNAAGRAFAATIAFTVVNTP